MDYLVGSIIGIVLGLTGAGGSVFAVPMLIYLLHLSPHSAIGLSLGVVCVSALFGVFARLRSGQIAWLPAIVYSVAGGLFTPVGVFLNQKIADIWLLLGFSCLVLIVAVRLWLQASQVPQQTTIVRSALSYDTSADRALCRNNYNAPFNLGLPCVAGISATAVMTGILSGLFGVGGGFLIVPSLLFLTGISIQQAVATSLVVIGLVSFSGFVSFIGSGYSVDGALFGRLAIGGVIGMIGGVCISRYIAGPVLQKTFSILMLVTALITVVMSVISF